MKSQLPKLLVLTSWALGALHGGGVVLDEVLRRYPRDRYVSFSVNPPAPGAGRDRAPESLRGLPSRTCPVVPRLGLRGTRFYMPVLRAVGFRVVALWRVRQAIAFAKRHDVELVWAELQGDVLVIAQRVAEGLGVPFVGTIWDDPEGWLADGGYDRFSRRLLRRRFREALRAARNLSVAGEAMQRAYENEYGVKSVILRHGFDAPVAPSEPRRDDDEIVIGFVGSPYGRDAWTAFLGAVARLNASGKFARLKVRTCGGGEFPYSHDGVEIEARGWQPADVMLKEIADTDFCYLPYWFEPAKRRHVELSFPNKFETYLAASRPIFFHGPDYAGIAESVRQHGVGLCAHNLNQGEIIAAIEKMISDFQLRDGLSRSAISAFHAEFNAEVMIRNFAELIGAEPRALQKPPEECPFGSSV